MAKGRCPSVNVEGEEFAATCYVKDILRGDLYHKDSTRKRKHKRKKR